MKISNTIVPAALLLSVLGLAACGTPSGPVATGASSTAPAAVSSATNGSVGAGNNSTHQNGTAGASGNAP